MRKSVGMLGTMVATVASLLGQVPEDFKWSWEEGRQPAATATVPPAAVEVLKLGETEEFKWSWEGEVGPTSGKRGETKLTVPVALQTTETVTVSSGRMPAAESMVAVSAYNELLQDNLQLRKKLDELSLEEQTLRKHNERLTREVADNERRIQQLTETVRKLKEEKALSEAEQKAKPDRIAELESKLTAAEAQKAKLAEEVTLLRAAAAHSSPGEGVGELKADSDLVKKLEADNVALRQKLAQVEEERQKLLREREQKATEISGVKVRQEELRNQVAAAKEQEKQYRSRIEELNKKLTGLEREVERLKARLAEKDSTLALKDKEVASLRLELEKREQRQARADQMRRILEEAEGDLRHASAREQRDLHYNMALMYVQQGKFKEAEAEYLRALRIDPNDAETHYNLAILYDDELKDKAKAAVHYRRYLKLRPDSPDAETVKLWLLRAETR